MLEIVSRFRNSPRGLEAAVQLPLTHHCVMRMNPFLNPRLKTEVDPTELLFPAPNQYEETAFVYK